MLRSVTFFSVTIAFLGAVFALHHVVPEPDPFALPRGNQVLQLDGYTRPQIAEMKLRHAHDAPKYDIGLFGNSRSLRVSEQNIELGACRFFNFSIHNSSYRNSLVMLEALAKMGKAPDIAIISVDNFVIQLFTNPVDIPLRLRWQAIFRDIVSAFTRSGFGLRERVRMIWRPLQGEGEIFAAAFKFDALQALWQKLSDTRAPDRLVSNDDVGYRRDGTRIQPPPRPGRVVKGIQPSTPLKASLGYLSLDMERFKNLQAQNIKIVLYESLLAPSSSDHYAASPSPAAEETRRAFHDNCRHLGLNCIPAPKRYPGPALPWFDASHSHPESLGRYLDGMITTVAPACQTQ